MWSKPARSDELYHWGKKKHRYIAKIGEGKDARYFYTQAELQAYKNKSRQLNEDAFIDTMENIMIGTANEYVNKAKEYKDKVDKAKKRSEEIGKDLKDKADNIKKKSEDIEKNVKDKGDNIKKKSEDIEKNVKDKVDKVKDKGDKAKNKIKDTSNSLKDFIDTKITGKAYYDKKKARDDLWDADVKYWSAQEARTKAKRLDYLNKYGKPWSVLDDTYEHVGSHTIRTKKSAGNYHHEANVYERQANDLVNKVLKNKRDYRKYSLKGRMEKRSKKVSRFFNKIFKKSTKIETN